MKTKQCKFSNYWAGICNAPCADEFCEEHQNTKCGICGEQATQTCPETVGSFVCGMPLCDRRDCISTHMNTTHNYNGEK